MNPKNTLPIITLIILLLTIQTTTTNVTAQNTIIEYNIQYLGHYTTEDVIRDMIPYNDKIIFVDPGFTNIPDVNYWGIIGPSGVVSEYSNTLDGNSVIIDLIVANNEVYAVAINDTSYYPPGGISFYKYNDASNTWQKLFYFYNNNYYRLVTGTTIMYSRNNIIIGGILFETRNDADSLTPTLYIAKFTSNGDLVWFTVGQKYTNYVGAGAFVGLDGEVYLVTGKVVLENIWNSLLVDIYKIDINRGVLIKVYENLNKPYAIAVNEYKIGVLIVAEDDNILTVYWPNNTKLYTLSSNMILLSSKGYYDQYNNLLYVLYLDTNYKIHLVIISQDSLIDIETIYTAGDKALPLLFTYNPITKIGAISFHDGSWRSKLYIISLNVSQYIINTNTSTATTITYTYTATTEYTSTNTGITYTTVTTSTDTTNSAPTHTTNVDISMTTTTRAPTTLNDSSVVVNDNKQLTPSLEKQDVPERPSLLTVALIVLIIYVSFLHPWTWVHSALVDRPGISGQKEASISLIITKWGLIPVRRRIVVEYLGEKKEITVSLSRPGHYIVRIPLDLAGRDKLVDGS